MCICRNMGTIVSSLFPFRNSTTYRSFVLTRNKKHSRKICLCCFCLLSKHRACLPNEWECVKTFVNFTSLPLIKNTKASEPSVLR